MQNRYSLRFDSTERQGESVPISGRGFVVGRKPGNSLQIVDGSVSGRHAEIEVHDTHVLLRDLGSTNGTRIGPNRVLEERLHHGDKVLFGNVQLTFEDAEFAEGAAPSAALDEPAMAGITAEKLAAAGGRRSILPLVVVLLLVGTLVGVWYFSQKAGGAKRAIRPVVAVAGNLLRGESFEGEASGWTAHESSSADFTRSEAAAYSGEVGLRASTAEGEWALHRSPEVRINAPGQLTLRGAIEVSGEGGAIQGRIGVEFLRPRVETADGESTRVGSSLFAWSAPRTETEGFESIEFPLDIPEGFDSARAVVFAAGDGVVDVDDVSLVARSGSAAADFKVGEFELRLLGENSNVGVLHKVDRFLISDLRSIDPDPARPAEDDAPTTATAALGGPGTALVATAAGDSGIRLTFDGSSLCFSIEPDALENGIATIGAGGYQVHSANFERTEVESLLVGIRKDLARLKFSSPVKLVARPAGARLDVVAEGPAGEVLLQLDFREERVEAGNLAYQARKEEGERRFGACITTWTKLLDDYPYESALVAEAEEVTNRLTQQGLEEVQAVQDELERGSFFRLVEIYWQCRSDAEAVATRYEGTEVAQAARKLIAEVDAEVAGLERDLQSYERGRLEGIRSALLASQATMLAAEVERYLNEKFGEGR